MKIILISLIVFGLILVSAQDIPYTTEIITARGSTTVPASFFNSGSEDTYTAVLEKNSLALRLETSSIFVDENSFGSFNLIIDGSDIPKGVYFDKLIISNSEGVFQEIPVIVGFESRSSEIQYDVSIDFDSSLDISIIAGETILSPKINVYKLNYNVPAPNSVALRFEVYSNDGDLLFSKDEVVSVSRQSSFEQFINLGYIDLNEVLIVVSAIRENSLGLDISKVSLSGSALFSPPANNYSIRIYMGIFIFLLSSIMLISYLWYNRSVNQNKDWKSQLNYVKKTQFSDAAKGIRKLQAQKDVLQRAYDSRYISRESFDSAIKEIDTLSEKLKKRL